MKVFVVLFVNLTFSYADCLGMFIYSTADTVARSNLRCHQNEHRLKIIFFCWPSPFQLIDEDLEMKQLPCPPLEKPF